MNRGKCLECVGPGDYFGDSDYRGMAMGAHWVCDVNFEGDLSFTVDDYEPNPEGGFDGEEYEKHTCSMCAKPTRKNWTLLHRIARMMRRFGSVKLWNGDTFLGEIRCDGSYATISYS